MSNVQEALKAAIRELKELKRVFEHDNSDYEICLCEAALSEIEKCEPVGWTNELQLSYLDDGDACLVYPDTTECPIPVFTSPPQREWIGLTDKRIAELKQRALEESNKYVAYCDLAEAKIAELKANTSQMVQAVSRAADAREAVMENEIHELQAYNTVLREALEAECGGRCNAEYNPCNARQALASTPAQSLQEHDNEVIEQVVTLLKDSAWDDGIIDMRVDDLIEDVRKLKGK